MDIIFDLIEQEKQRQNNGLELIASENYCSKEIREACGSILTNKYAEGYPNKRYYGGCENVDDIETIAISRACDLFKCKYANVQPHSGSQANAAAYRALEVYLSKRNKFIEEIEVADGYEQTQRQMRILSIQLNDGGHLTHGSNVSFSSYLYNFDFYSLGENGKLDLSKIEDKIESFNPDVLLIGYSAYPYNIDFISLSKLAHKHGCLFMVDMAHIAGIVAAGECQNPCYYADIVTSTTHKTLRGPRGGLILTNNDELIRYINSAVFPYYQGGPLEHIIAGKAICFKEAINDEFKTYINKVLENTKRFTEKLKEYKAICSDTENHLMLLNTKESYGLTGLEAQKKLEEIGITTNKNMLPNDTEKPNTTSGLRIGFAALTTRGCNTHHVEIIASIINSYLKDEITKLEARKCVFEIVEELKRIEDI